jgi:hypothetical protein
MSCQTQAVLQGAILRGQVSTCNPVAVLQDAKLKQFYKVPYSDWVMRGQGASKC